MDFSLGDENMEEYFLQKSPAELSLLFSGGEVTTSKPHPDPVPDIPKETVSLAVKSRSESSTVVSNHPSPVPVGKKSYKPSRDPNMVLLPAHIVIYRSNVAGLDIPNLIKDVAVLLEEFLNHHVTFQLVSNEVDPVTKSGKLSSPVTVEDWGKLWWVFVPRKIEFILKFYVAKDFGVPGAIIAINGHQNFVVPGFKTVITTEFNLKEVCVTMPDKSEVKFACDSWIYASGSKKQQEGRVFFVNKEYTPATTPDGLVQLRENELKNLQGDGTGERKEGDRIYDYDVYNDLGTPKDPRPILGGSEDYPYPRRCRTGRKKNKDGKTEERLAGALATNYIPRDERFDEVRTGGFIKAALGSRHHGNAGEAALHYAPEFRSFEDIRRMYAPVEEKSNLEILITNQTQPADALSVASVLHGDDKSPCMYPIPKIIAADKDAWSQDVEFARQVLAGINPLMIELLKEFPLKRNSAVTAKIVEPQLEGLSISEALTNKRLFVLDYHDWFMRYIQRINEQKGSQAYASWTLFFLTNVGVLKPVCIELALPPASGEGSPRFRVFRPTEQGATTNWAWELAKAHVQSNDAAWHQLISHWLRTHAVIEPFVIATNRQLSILHPVHKALVAHYKGTMAINQQARSSLINAGGVIEQTFTPQKYVMEISAGVYKEWRFVDQALPNDLVKRGLAVPDATAPHGLKLVIEDYPYTKDGLELWAAIRAWATDHIDLFYATDADVQADVEVQNWWTEVLSRGHGDIKEGWILADSKDNLVQIITTIAWVASCHHAAVNFGQYMYAGFMPNHPSLTRKLIPEENTPEWEKMQRTPEQFWLSMLTNPALTRINMTTIEILSTHAENEEYLGDRPRGWTSNSKVEAAFAKFSKRIEEIDALIDSRNQDPSLKNRHGPTKVRYELLVPKSEPGLTNYGIPNSISI